MPGRRPGLAWCVVLGALLDYAAGTDRQPARTAMKIGSKLLPADVRLVMQNDIQQ